MSLLSIHQDFMHHARRSLVESSGPIKPKETRPPLVPTNRWTKTIDKALERTFDFSSSDQRNYFIERLLEHESEVGHHAVFTVTKDSVSVKLTTDGGHGVTELDWEFSKFLSETFKDSVYSVSLNEF